MLRKSASLAVTTLALLGSATVSAPAAYAQGTPDPAAQPAPATPPAAPAAPEKAAPEKEVWKGPFGGTFTAGFAVLNDYSYRGISQTQRDVAVQASSEKIPLSAYVGVWGSNVNFPGTGASVELDLTAGFRLKALDDKLTFDLGYIRYNYLGAPENLYLDFNEFGLVAGYDFGFAQLQAAVRYSPNFFANSGNAWYKWGQVTVPLPFLYVNENVSFKVFGSVGNQSVERYTNYGIPNDNYWDWQAGVVVNLYGFDLSAVYTGTNLSVQDCLGTQNCASRVIIGISKSF